MSVDNTKSNTERKQRKEKSGNNGNKRDRKIPDYRISNTSNEHLLYRFAKRVITRFILN